jgi:hypothetical protein
MNSRLPTLAPANFTRHSRSLIVDVGGGKDKSCSFHGQPRRSWCHGVARAVWKISWSVQQHCWDPEAVVLASDSSPAPRPYLDSCKRAIVSLLLSLFAHFHLNRNSRHLTLKTEHPVKSTVASRCCRPCGREIVPAIFYQQAGSICENAYASPLEQPTVVPSHPSLPRAVPASTNELPNFKDSAAAVASSTERPHLIPKVGYLVVDR